MGKHDINKQIIYIAPKSKIESRAHYVPEPAQVAYAGCPGKQAIKRV